MTKTKKKIGVKKEMVVAKEHIEKKTSIFKKIIKTVGYILTTVSFLILLIFGYMNLPVAESSNKAELGVTFSSRYAGDIGLDWKKAYVAMLDELGVRNIRVPIYWDLVEKTDGNYDFADLDWQLSQASARGAKIILVMGKKVPRWPECFVPEWAPKDASGMQERLLAFETVVINRYKDGHPEITKWQIENEPFLDFGMCGPTDTALLDSEIAQTRKLDPSRPIIVTDSGELSLWLKAASRADIFGTTMYREVYSARLIFGRPLGHWRYPIGPNFFKLKQLFIKLFAHQDNAIVIELQGEPWVQGWTTSAPVETQLASMNATALADNVSFAKKTGMKEVYIWGVEWWYWMKVEQNNPTLWEEAKILFKQ